VGSEKGCGDPHAEATTESTSFHGKEYENDKGNDVFYAVRAEAKQPSDS
jgi:hypothetical protein